MAQSVNLSLNAAGYSVVGPRRRDNQDSGHMSSQLVVVADGVGGSPCGDIASMTAVTALADALHGLHSLTREVLTDRVQWVNQQLAERMVKDPCCKGMATTMTGLIVDGDQGWLVHVGDSRAYRMHDGALEQISVDQSWVQMMLERNEISPEELRNHPMRNMLMHCLTGSRRDLEAIRILPVEMIPGDRWLLCSDGLSSYLPAPRLETLCTSELPVAELAEALHDEVLPCTKDNVTVIVAEVGQIGTPTAFIGAAAPQDSRAMVG